MSDLPITHGLSAPHLVPAGARRPAPLRPWRRLWRAVLRLLSRRRSQRFYDLLSEHARAARDAALALEGIETRGSTVEEASAAVAEVERTGERLSSEMEEALMKTRVTPIHREDLQRLSADLDEVIALTARAVRADGLRRGVASVDTSRLAPLLAKSTAVVAEAVSRLERGDHEAVLIAARDLRTIGADVALAYHEQVVLLTEGKRDVAKTENVELLRDLTVLVALRDAIEHCTVTVARSLAYVAWRNA